MSQPSFGRLLRSYRHEAKLTLEGLAEASGVSARAISDMERGHSRAPQRRTLEALADALKLAPEQRAVLISAADSGRTRSGPEGTCEPPRPVPDFVGRAHQLSELRRHCAQVDTDSPAPVVVIHGPPGLGKTVLAVHAANQLRDQFPDGVFFLELRGFDDVPVNPNDALARLLPALGVSARRMATDLDERSAQFRAVLRERRCVVILDNAGTEAQVRALLPGTGTSAVLITSRRALAGLEGVRRFPLDPFTAEESAELLLSIVGHGSDRVTAPAAADVARLCENLPLALRIAANRLLSRPGWTMAHLAARLSDEDRRLATLTAGDLGIEAAFGLSYRQLSDQARQTFRRLSLVPGADFGAPLAAVLAQSGLTAVEDHLDELADLGLLQSDRGDRYRFHDLIRLYASARLEAEEAEPDQRAARDRMVRWLLENVISAGQWFEVGASAPVADRPGALTFDSAEAAGDWLQLERDNWFGALGLAASAGEDRLVVDVAESMHWYSDRTAHWTQWTDVYRMSQEAAGRLGDDRLTATHLNYLSWALYECARRPEEAIAVANEALEVARRVGDHSQQGWALAYIASARYKLGDLEAVLAAVNDALVLHDAAGDHDGYAEQLQGKGRVLFELGRIAEAEATLRSAILAADERPLSPTARMSVRCLASVRLGECLGLQGRWAEAHRELVEALPMVAQYSPTFHAQGLYWLGRASQEVGATAEARTLLTEALALAESVENEGILRMVRDALTSLESGGGPAQ